jgi:tRNA-dihydrouridine synthase B
MVSAKGFIYGLKNRFAEEGAGAALLRTCPKDTPLVVQLFGSEPEFITSAVEELKGRGYAFFDLNMGCPVPKVTRNGAGSALLRDTVLAARVAGALFRAAGEGRAGCKLRLGPDAAHPVYLDLGRMLEAEGAAWLTLHPRYGKQGFSGSTDPQALEILAGGVKIPVLASGDLFSARDAVQCLNLGVSGVMFGRGALADPFIFRRYLNLINKGEEAGGEVPEGAAARLALTRRHAQLAQNLMGERLDREGGIAPALLKMRSIAPRYLRSVPGIKRLRADLIRCVSWEEFYALLDDFFSAPNLSEGEKCV